MEANIFLTKGNICFDKRDFKKKILIKKLIKLLIFLYKIISGIHINTYIYIYIIILILQYIFVKNGKLLVPF